MVQTGVAGAGMLSGRMEFVAAMSQEGWRPGIGDPTFMGWLIAITYLIAAAACWRAWRRERGLRAVGRERVLPGFWLSVGVAMLLLGINKQLDLQTWLTEVGRAHAKAHGWYAQHRYYQALFIAGIAAAGFVVLCVLAWVIRRAWRRYLLALAGIVCLTCFVIIRAASFHHVDAMLGYHWGALKINHVLELSGILMVLGAAVRLLQRPVGSAALVGGENGR